MHVKMTLCCSCNLLEILLEVNIDFNEAPIWRLVRLVPHIGVIVVEPS